MREIIFDTETTGLDPKGGDRLVEIGCLELINHIPTGHTFHTYINPERPVPADAVKIHGLDDKFLADKPVFAAIVDDFLAFVGDGTLIAHNATFDMGFINAELTRVGRAVITNDHVIDTLILARRKHPAGPNSLDALCSRYQIDTSRRTFHGALLDSELLAEVYIELIGGRQAALGLGEQVESQTIAAPPRAAVPSERPVPRRFKINADEIAAHGSVVEAIGEKALWHRYLDKT